MDKEYLKPKEVAEMLDVHPMTVYRMIKSGAINVVTLPTPTNKKKRYRIHIAEINNLLTKNNSYDGDRDPQNQKDPGSGGDPIPALGDPGGDTPRLEQEDPQDDVPVQQPSW